MNDDPLVSRHPALINNGSERRGESATETGCCLELHFRGQANKILIRVVNSHILGKRTPMGEPGLKLMIANLLVSRMTLRTLTAAAHKGHCDSITDLPFRNRVTYRFNNTCQLVTRDMR